MPMPWGYRHADRTWKAFLADAKDRLNLVSDDQAYTAVDAVLQVFRRRLTPAQGIAFADVLPELLRALFVYRWDVAADPLPFPNRDDLVAEVMAVRPDHNGTPPHAIEAVAWAPRRHVRQRDLDRVLDRIGPAAREFWHVDVADPHELEQRIV